MTSEYQSFRKRKLDELTRDEPSMRYKDKMGVVTREWKEFKESQILTPMNPVEMTTLTINSSFKTRLRSTKIECIPEMICLIGRFSQMGETDFIINNFKSILCKSQFLEMSFNGVDLWDMLAINNGGYVILYILEGFSTNKDLKTWVGKMNNEKRMGNLLNSLVSVIYDKPNAKNRVINLIIRLIYNGVSPNTEFQCGQYTASLPHPSEDRNINSVEGKPIRYVGTTLIEEEYGEKYPVVLGSVRFVGDTLFGFLIQNICNNKVYSFIITLIDTNLVSMATVAQPYSLSLDTHMDYLTMAMRFSPMLYHNQVTCAVYRKIPKYVLLRGKNINNLRNMVYENLKTNWRGMVFFNTCPRNIIHYMLEDGLLEPSDEFIYKHLRLSPPALKSVQYSVVHGLLGGKLTGNVYENIPWNRYEETVLENLVYTSSKDPSVHREAVNELIRGYGYRYFETYHNDEYFSTSDPIDIYSVGVFVSEDGYVFCRDELEYLVRTKTNPFNRRNLSVAEIDRLNNIITLFNNFWYLFDLSSQKYRWLLTPICEPSDEDYAKLIDELFDKSEVFTYGGRMTEILDKLLNNALCILGFTGLVTGVGTMISINSDDISIDQCSSYARCREDPSDVEDINTYFGIMFNHIRENGKLRRVFLQWLYVVLETTDKSCRSHIMTARLLSLTLFIQMAKTLR